MVDEALTGMRRWQETWQGHVCSGTKAQACMSDWLGCLWTVFFSKRHIAYFSMLLFLWQCQTPPVPLCTWSMVRFTV